MTTEQTDRSWVHPQLALRRTVDAWIASAITRQSGSPWQGGHDEANYTCSWPGHYLLTGDNRIKAFLLWLRDSYRDWSAENEYHGFRADARDYATHTFENHTGFISSLCEMDPTDRVNDALIEDVAHHIGNWEPGVPDWYDWDAHMIVSHWLGTQEVKNYPPWDLTSTRHARIARLALKAWETSGKQRYLDWTDDYLGRWCDEIAACDDRIPMMLYHTPRDEVTPAQRTEMGPRRWDDYSNPYQDLRWAGAIHELLRLIFEAYPLIGNDRYLDAVRKAVSICQRAVAGDSGKTTGLISTMLGYRDLTGDDCYDDAIGRWHREYLMPRLDAPLEGRLTANRPSNGAAIDGPLPDTLIGPLDGGRKGFGIDGGDGTIRVYDGPTAAQYRMGYDAGAEMRYLTRAMQMAERYLALSAAWVRDGREHGCGAAKYMHGEGSPAAILLQSTTGVDHVLYSCADGTPGLDEAVAALAQPADGGLRLTLVNTADEDKTVRIGARQPGKQIASADADVADGRATVQVPAGAAACVSVSLK